MNADRAENAGAGGEETVNGLLNAILARRSVRKYNGKPIPGALLRELLLAGVSAPSAHDSRPWRIAAVVSAQGRQTLISALATRFEGDMTAAGLERNEISRRLARSREIFSGAAALLVLFARATAPDNPLAKDHCVEQLLTAQSVALAGGQLLLAASALGLGGCWFAAPLFCSAEVCAACGLPAGLWMPQCLITLGYPAEEPGEKEPPLLKESVFFL